MGRVAKLGRKNGHWYSEAGGEPRYYGKVGEVDHDAALQELYKYLAGPMPEGPTVAELAGKFLGWVARNRAPLTEQQRRRHVSRWCAHVGGRLKAADVRAEHLESFLATLGKTDAGRHHEISIRQLFHRSVRMGWIDRFPFATVEPIRLPLEPLSEADLLTRAEVGALFEWADVELPGQRGPGWCRDGFGDMLRVYHATGARTAELWAARVADFQPRTRQLVLGKHKRSATQKTATVRQIHLNDEALAIVGRACAGRPADQAVFIRPAFKAGLSPARPWNRPSICRRFQAVRRRAGVREAITLYDFRHLWISEAVMAGVDVFLVARMAGTSVMMIEQVYGHFRSQSLQDAQARLDAARKI